MYGRMNVHPLKENCNLSWIILISNEPHTWLMGENSNPFSCLGRMAKMIPPKERRKGWAEVIRQCWTSFCSFTALVIFFVPVSYRSTGTNDTNHVNNFLFRGFAQVGEGDLLLPFPLVGPSAVTTMQDLWPEPKLKWAKPTDSTLGLASLFCLEAVTGWPCDGTRWLLDPAKFQHKKEKKKGGIRTAGGLNLQSPSKLKKRRRSRCLIKIETMFVSF